MFRVPSKFSLFCIFSVLGIWPRFIEPYLLKTTHIKLPLVKEKFKIVQISDLHFHGGMQKKFLSKTVNRINEEMPDLIAITGDFLCHGYMYDSGQLEKFLKALKSRLGVFAVLGNHDFNVALSINKEGDYDAISKISSPFLSGMTRLLRKPKLTGIATVRASLALPHSGLLQVLKDSSVTLLNNETLQVGPINLTGLGEWMAASTDPEKAFKSYDPNKPGVILVHNPDAVQQLASFPGQLILSGHTHGGQINLPWLWKRFTAMENPLFKKGKYLLAEKLLYISGGIGGVTPFRFNTLPEIVSISLGGV